MAKNIKENRVVNVVEDKPRSKWAGLVADEKELKRWKNTWEEIEENITSVKRKSLSSTKKR